LEHFFGGNEKANPIVKAVRKEVFEIWRNLGVKTDNHNNFEKYLTKPNAAKWKSVKLDNYTGEK